MPKDKNQSFKKKLLLTLSSIIITSCLGFLAGEIYVRSNYPYRTPETLRESSLEFEPTLFARHALPKVSQSFQDANGTGIATVNDKGYRGDNFDISKPPGKIRIIIIGGSGVFDIHAPENQDWPHLVENYLLEENANVEVINAGIPGHASWDSVGRLYSEIWQFDPDIILLYNAWNDIKYFCSLSQNHSLLREYRPYEISTEYSNRLIGNPFMYYSGPIDQFFSTYSQFYVRLRWGFLSLRYGDGTIEGLSDVNSPESTEQYPDSCGDTGIQQYEFNLRLFADITKNMDATPILVTQARLVSENNTINEQNLILYDRVKLSHQGLVDAFQETDDAIYRVSIEEDVSVIDLSIMNGNSAYFVDQIHTTPQGSQKIASIVGEFLLNILEE